ncbi:MAG: symmetrical bis(5'-nucleosyl)-tetraphosphatase [Burkholderiaceae bacterium]|jgi:bis(5'-nucleosyl)-tetraphosphatase (symmetrical)|nr:symmetrical bis(5'-nucleosyl)-tetraphosphatase [Burkholderiaceae bacterium]
MSLYLIGDVQGCDQALGRLLERVDFSPSRDRLIVLGDLVNRGPQSLAVLRRLMALGNAAACLLGNHDLHLLAMSQGARKPQRDDTLNDILHAPERAALIDWLRRRPLALRERGVLMVHAGVLPQWTAAQALSLAAEVEAVLSGSDWSGFMHRMYGSQPDQWQDDLQGAARLRVIVNALTRLRFCSVDGRMEFATKDRAADGAPPGYVPWFDVPGRRTARDVIAFGHWSALGWLEGRPELISLDTGCVWGGFLSAVRLGADAHERELIQVRCAQSRRPGAGV